MWGVLLRYILLTALRDRLFLALILMLAAGASLSIFLGSGAIVERREMAAAYMGAGSRVVVVLGMVLFVSFHVRRAVEGGEMALIASRPISRVSILLGYTGGVVAIAAIFALFAAALIAFGAQPAWDGLMIWGATLFLESALMSLVALFFALSLGSAVSGVLSCLGFYVLARMSGLLADLADQSASGGGLDLVLGMAFQIISIIIPRLDLFCQSEWLVYGWDGEARVLGWALGQGLVFVPLILAAAIFDFTRKRI